VKANIREANVTTEVLALCILSFRSRVSAQRRGMQFVATLACRRLDAGSHKILKLREANLQIGA